MWLELTCAILGAAMATFLYDSFYKEPLQSLATTINASYDYVIVGGGSAGCVLANRLSEDPDVTVLLIEAGGDDRGRDDISTPAFYGRMLHTDVDWDYISVPQKHGFDDLVGKRVYFPRGRVLGGSSSTNYLCYVRGHPRDFDSWAEQGCDGWSYEDVLPYFFKLEGFVGGEFGDSALLGKDGALKIEHSNTLKLNEFLINAARDLGFSLFDYMSGKGEGLSPLYTTTYRGERYSTSRAYLHPVLTRTNLHVAVDSYVTRVILEGSVAVGVDVIRRSKKEKVLAKTEVILSAGVFGSPKILMLSGIGPRQHLRDLGIPVLVDLPVGDNLHDHVIFDYQVTLQKPVSRRITDFSNIWSKFQFHLFGTGVLSKPGHDYQMFVSTNNHSKELGWPDLQVLFPPVLWNTRVLRSLGFLEEVVQEAARRDEVQYGLTCFAANLRPRSRGTFRLQSSDPFDDPLIDPNYFRDPKDVVTLLKGIDICKSLVQTPSLQSLGARPADGPSAACVGPNSPYDSEAYWTCMVRRRSVSYYHPVGTAKMGSANDSTAVVDTTLRVRGISGLRVVDASVIPSIPSANTNAAVIMIAEKASDIIRANRKSVTKQ
ncbi:hypothetical protein C0Q70_11594 [Pomacea canaliculata]|uniref:Glucose-methanol-choline oxidoreductase N-terminal domain-containing protein n=1 Tax=Pomacea canaliculata TaxID=400727 RepID=A0A2T7P6E7_POMCA|nr:uncharacterized protein LOC112565696 [Pomacea canaliculata]PVD28997.1 hypothetical protein C0Q70_11594 [Pomacea canaliculata]